jgi:hypothetical protein
MSVPSTRFWVEVEGRCSEWKIEGKIARYSGQTSLGEVVLELQIDPTLPIPHWRPSYRRLGPIEELEDELEKLACWRCFDDDHERDPLSGRPWTEAFPKQSGRWFGKYEDCEAATTGSAEARAAAQARGQTVTHSVIHALSESGARDDEEDDARQYDEVMRRLETAQAKARTRLGQLHRALSRSRQVFVRTEKGCQAWNLRLDAGSPSGWVSRIEDEPSAGRNVQEFRFAAHFDSVELAGWLITPLPSSDEERVEVLTSFCTERTTLVDASAERASFIDQTWYFSRAACRSAKAPDSGHRSFGPSCDRTG